jgi:hypothetical protein
MAKTFRADSNAVVIYEDGYLGTGLNNLVDYPLTSNNSQYLYFHSDYSFLRSPVSLSVNLSLEAKNTGLDCAKKKGGCVTVPSAGTATTLLFSGDYSSKVVLAVDTATGRSLVGTMWVQKLGDSTLRTINIFSNSTGIYAEEQWFAYSNNLPALTLNIKIYVLSSLSESRTTLTEKLYLAPTAMRTNGGLFNTNFGYVDINIDSVTYSGSSGWTSWYSSWNTATDKPDPNSIRRYITYEPTANRTKVYWDAFIKYDGTVEGVYADVVGNVTSGVINGLTYERGSLVDTRYVFNNTTQTYTTTVAYYVYQVRRQVPNSTATRPGGVVFPNGPTLSVSTDVGGVGAAMAFSFDGITATYGLAPAFPSNTLYSLNLL